MLLSVRLLHGSRWDWTAISVKINRIPRLERHGSIINELIISPCPPNLGLWSGPKIGRAIFSSRSIDLPRQSSSLSLPSILLSLSSIEICSPPLSLPSICSHPDPLSQIPVLFLSISENPISSLLLLSPALLPLPPCLHPLSLVDDLEAKRPARSSGQALRRLSCS